MDKLTARACFSHLTKRNASNPLWRRAVSWLFHGEREEEVIGIFCLDAQQLADAHQAVNILFNQGAYHGKVYAWATK
jgi:hypothetical protein